MTPPYEKPLPVVDAESKPFWDAAKQHRLMVQRCQDCAVYFFYPRALCPACHGERLTWETVSGEGTVYSFTVARRPAGPAFKGDVPYVVALIELREGARILSTLITKNVDAVRIGDRVRVVYDDVTPEITLPKFEPAG